MLTTSVRRVHLANIKTSILLLQTLSARALLHVVPASLSLLGGPLRQIDCVGSVLKEHLLLLKTVAPAHNAREIPGHLEAVAQAVLRAGHVMLASGWRIRGATQRIEVVQTVQQASFRLESMLPAARIARRTNSARALGVLRVKRVPVHGRPTQDSAHVPCVFLESTKTRQYHPGCVEIVDARGLTHTLIVPKGVRIWVAASVQGLRLGATVQ
jgi:hypothetical protein